MDRILSSLALQKLLGLLVFVMGLVVGAFFLLADVIGVGDRNQFGTLQIVGMVVSALIVVGGANVYSSGLRAPAT